jgi:hypothetical protein
MALEQFARDFGYLDKFLAGLAKHAETLPPDRGSRLKALMAEEVTRWDEVKRLLAGGAPAATPASVAPPPAPAPGVAAPSAPAPGPAAAMAPQGLTVGSLLGVPKK